MPKKRRPLSVRQSTEGRPQNRLLALLPDEDFHHLRPHLQTVPVRRTQVFHKAGERLRHVYFLNGGVCSLTTRLSHGAIVEAATIGDSGFVGIEAFLRDDAVSLSEAIMQVPDTDAERLSVKAFRRALAERPVLRTLLGRYLQVVIGQMMQTTACNVHHSVRERCVRWLLIAHDHMHRQNFTLSHAFLAEMLGASRPTVSAVAGQLQAAGLIRYSHGRVTVVDRTGLEAVSCDCYAAIRAHFDCLQPGRQANRTSSYAQEPPNCRQAHRP
ncbi:MAG TPA: Crp/Fnr family transcriptional regulator [Vicinamibacterales bacterium]|nr:Crp/Fnr family transcriptional regulator [Vicinamibacterales bacterium]